jgi:hypothetical protein
MDFPLSAIYKFIKSADTYRYGQNFLLSGHFYSKYRTVFSVKRNEEFHYNQFILYFLQCLEIKRKKKITRDIAVRIRGSWLWIFFHPGSESRIPGQKAPDPVSGSATLDTTK